jgi:hypothetical protein
MNSSGFRCYSTAGREEITIHQGLAVPILAQRMLYNRSVSSACRLIHVHIGPIQACPTIQPSCHLSPTCRLNTRQHLLQPS